MSLAAYSKPRVFLQEPSAMVAITHDGDWGSMLDEVSRGFTNILISSVDLPVCFRIC